MVYVYILYRGLKRNNWQMKVSLDKNFIYIFIGFTALIRDTLILGLHLHII